MKYKYIFLMSENNWKQQCEWAYAGSPFSSEASILHTFVFQREQTHQSSLVDITINSGLPQLNLSALFQQYAPLRQNKISIYDPDLNKFTPLEKIGAERSGIIPRAMLEPRIIMVRFRKYEPSAMNSESDSGIESGMDSDKGAMEKKDRSRERTIGEAIQLVKKWRMVHLDSIKSGLRKLSLADAAKSIGVSKKTLDDYYYQLRLGQFYLFDFSNNLNQKVGALRAYVKAFKPDREEKNKNLRHPKNLKIIQSFELDLPVVSEGMPETPPSPMFEELRSPASFQSLPLEDGDAQGFEQKENPYIKDVMSSYEDKFFKNFEFSLDDANDPFIEIDRNFKKKLLFDDSGTDFFYF